MKEDKIKKIRAAMTKRKIKTSQAPIRRKDGLSTGSTVLNMACSGWPEVGFFPGHYYYIVGDSSSGKTFLSLTCFAEAANNPKFDDYRLIFDAPEDGALMDFTKFFGKKMANRMEIPDPSRTVEEFYDRQQAYLDDGRPFISVLDSMDVLDSIKDIKYQRKKAAARESGDDDGKGSYGMNKPKENSTRLRSIVSGRDGLAKTGSILIIISQTRDNISRFSRDPKTRSGGNALKFYATLEMWSSIKERIKKKVKNKDRQVGIICRVRMKKNRLQGKERVVDLPIYYSVGFDDIGGCIDYLIDEGHWKGTKGKVTAPEFEFSGMKEKLIQQIEEQDSLDQLREIVKECWDEIEAACEVQRKPRYE